MSDLVLRRNKDKPLNHSDVDNNFIFLLDKITNFKGGSLIEIDDGWSLQRRIDNGENYCDIGAGAIDFSYSDDTKNYGAGGARSFAIGFDVTATGDNSFSSGMGSLSMGENGFSSGEQTRSLGRSAVATGFRTTADASFSSASGQQTRAHGVSSHAEGYLTESNGDDSHAEGCSTKADGE